MDAEIVVKITEAGKLELPDEIRESFQAGEEYLVSRTKDEIRIRKAPRSKVDLNEFFRRLNEAPLDPNQPSLEEISEMVKEVRRERRAKQQQHENRS